MKLQKNEVKTGFFNINFEINSYSYFCFRKNDVGAVIKLVK